jgi:hypothetical protein
MNALRTVSLMAATVSTGLVAGVFALYAHTIMPGLAKTDDRTFVGAFQSIDRAIINPWFIGGGFFGALVFTIVAAIAQLGEDGLPGLPAASPTSARSVSGSTRHGGRAGTSSAWSPPPLRSACWPGRSSCSAGRPDASPLRETLLTIPRGDGEE